VPKDLYRIEQFI